MGWIVQLCQLAGYPDVFSDVIHIVLDLHQEVLQWVKVVTLNIERALNQSFQNPKAVKRLIVAIPGREWQAEFGRKSVFHLLHRSERDSRNGFWNGPFKEGPHQDDVEWTEQHWDDQSPDGITQLQELRQCTYRYQPCTKRAY